MLYLGIDHSLTAFGVAAIPDDWDLDFTRVRRRTWETKPDRPVPERRAMLAASLANFVRRLEVPPSEIRAAIEGGIFHARRPESIISQERLAGVVEHELWKQHGIRLTVAYQGAVRGTFMGKSAAHGKGAGAAAQALLGKIAPATRSWFEGELDAFLVANHLASLDAANGVPIPFVTCAPGEMKQLPESETDSGKRNSRKSPRNGRAPRPKRPRVVGQLSIGVLE